MERERERHFEERNLAILGGIRKKSNGEKQKEKGLARGEGER